jgi:glycosyltransferase involved in cell wall biosynthesis
VSARADRSSVLIDATSIPLNRGGVGRYLDGVIPALHRAGASIIVVCKHADAERFRAWGVAVVEAPPRMRSTPSRFVWEQWGLPRLAKRTGVDVIHSPHYTFPLATRRRRVVTVHDLTFFSHPELHTRLKGLFFRFWVRLSRVFSVVVVAPSAATAAEYVRVTGADPTRVIVALHGYDSEHFHEPTRDEIDVFRRSQHPPVSRWIGFLGTLEPRKNVVNLISAFRAATVALEPDERPALLLAGGPGWDTKIDPAVENAIAAGFDVRKIGYVPLSQISGFLGGSEIVAYPSLGEGFGLPVLEAMATGACVVTTRRLALPEVGGEAVAYSDVDAASISQVLTELLAIPAERHRLAAAAARRAAEFTWARCADKHVDAYLRSRSPR